LDILFIKARHLGCHLDVLFAVRNLDARPASRESGGAPDGWQAGTEAAKYIVEQPVHLTMQREERVTIAVAKEARNPVAVVSAPWNQVTDAHLFSPLRSID